MNALLQQFLQESREAIEGIGHSLLAMERDPQDVARLDELFRLVHTLKGNSGLFEFPALTQVLHAAEDVMDAVRQHSLPFSQALADQLLDAADYVTLFLDEVEANEQPGEAFSLAPRALVEGLRSLLGETDSTPQDSLERNTAAPLDMQLPTAAQARLEQAWAEQQTVFYVDYQPDAQCFFNGTDPLHQVRQLPQVLWQRVRAREPWPGLETLDAYACNLRIELLLISTEAELAEHFRYVRETVNWRVLTPAPLAAAEPFSALALQVLQAQVQVLQRYVAVKWPHGAQLAALRTLENVLRCERPQLLGELAEVVQQLDAGSGAELLLMWLNDLLAQEPARQPVASEQRIDNWLGELLDVSPAEAAAPALQTQALPADTSPMRRSEEGVAAPAKVLKVEQEKIDRLMNYIGEIVVAKNGLPYLAERAEQQYGQRELAREIKAQYAVINRIAQDLQDSIMQVRLMPVSFVLQRFPRLVRDITRKLGKQVNLVLEGEETEADKAMIEALADPLVHVVRNALDHGLETVAEREQAGKPVCGTLRIRASQNGDHVLLDIEDDGRGIDPQKIKAKVQAKGLIEPEKLVAMSDQELINLVFLPGFSTAEQISDLSGRGVGMDVVRAAIERVGGHLRLSSQLGVGTKLSLSLPLSMAVTQVMVIESAGQRFGVPMEQVVETVRLPREAIHHVKQQPLAQLRGRTIPPNGLNELLALGHVQRLNEDDEHALMVLRSRGELLGLLIDDFHGSVDIILKPMVGILGDMPGYCGTAVMGDGSILMVLNPAEMFA